MALPIRRAAPQPRPKPVGPKRIAPAQSGGTPRATVIARGRIWIPRPRITASHRVVPALSGGTGPAIQLTQGIKRGPTKNNRSRIVAVAVAGGSAVSTIIGRGKVWLPRPRITASRRVAPSAAGGTPPSTITGHGRVWTPRPRITSSRRVVPAPVVVVANVTGTFIQGLRRPTGKPPKARIVLAPSGGTPPATAGIQGVRRPPTKNGRSRTFQAPSGGTPKAIILKGARWAAIRSGRARAFTGIAPAAPPVAATSSQQGVRRVHPKRPPLTRLFVAPIVISAPAISVSATLISRSGRGTLQGRTGVAVLLSRSGVAALLTRLPNLVALARSGIAILRGR